MASALMLRDLGLEIMRASAFKPRSSPYSFQGLGVEGLHILKRIRERTGVLVETEVMDVRDIETAAELVDVIRIGARNMQNFDLLKEAGLVQTPVILKRGMANTIREFLLATEYILQGNPNVILCERGIRSFETAYRNTLDVGAIAVLKQETHLPVIADPQSQRGKQDAGAGPLAGRGRGRGRRTPSSRCIPTPRWRSATGISRSIRTSS